MSFISNLIGQGVTDALMPGTPGVSGILNKADAAYYGTLMPSQQNKLSKDQSKLATDQADLASGTGGKGLQGHIAQLNSQIDKLNSLSAQDQKEGYLNQFLTNLTGELPQLQAISASQNTAADQSALQGQQQFGLPAGQAILGAQQALAPQFYNNQTALGQTLGQGGNLQNGSFAGLTPQQTQFYNQQFMGNQAAQGLGSSPLGAQNAAFQLTGLNQQQSNFNEQALQQYLGGYLQPSVPNIFGQQSQSGLTSATSLGGNSLQAIDPSSIANLQSSLTGLNYNTQVQNAQSLGSSLGQLGGALLTSAFGGVGGIGGAIGGAAGGGAAGGLGGLASLSGFFGGSSGMGMSSTGNGSQIGIGSP
jgi:hypothetical protein